MNGPMIGCIADDITGATDLSDALTRRGISTTQLFGSPEGTLTHRTRAVVVGLKTRNLPAEDAVAQSVASLRWLLAQGMTHVVVKYCSTFDSTAAGNIGPVVDALADELAAALVLHSPSYPANGRTVYQGHLFLGTSLLSETGMRDHPLTPMTDSNLVQVLRAQTPRSVGLLPLTTVRQRDGASQLALDALLHDGVRHVIADAVDDDDLDALARLASLAGHRLAAGGAAFGAAFAAATVGRDHLSTELPAAPKGGRAILVGSASVASRQQVAAFAGVGVASLVLRPEDLDTDRTALNRAVAWATKRIVDSTVMVSVEREPGALVRSQQTLGQDRAAALIEQAMGQLAVALVQAGVHRLIVAGGETSGAVVDALGVRKVRIGPSISTGVPWTVWTSDANDADIAIAFKSGNFGGEHFFSDAFACFDGDKWRNR